MNYYTPGIVDSDPRDGNYFVDKHISDSHLMKSIYFYDEDEYAESFKSNHNDIMKRLQKS